MSVVEKDAHTVKVRGSEIFELALGYFKIEIARNVRPSDKCWKCLVSVNEMEHSMSVATSKNSINRMFCNPCALILMEQGVKVFTNRLPIDVMRKLKIASIMKGS